MPRKRPSRRARHPAPLILTAIVFAALVVYAVYPRAQHRRVASRQSVPVAAVSPSPEPLPVTTSTPAATAQPSAPIASPTAAYVPHNAGTAQVAIIIDDCGQWLDTERALIALPIPITLAVLPHVRYSQRIAQEAAAAGKGVMLHLPMEPVSHIYPGPGEIKDGMTDGEVIRQTEDDLAQVPLAKGANNHEGSLASADDRVMKDVMSVMKEHHLFFVDSRTSAKTVAQQVAQEDGVQNARRNVFLDNDPDLVQTEAQLEQAVAIAERHGSAIAIGHPKPTTLAAIRALYPKLQAEGVQFVLAQDLVH